MIVLDSNVLSALMRPQPDPTRLDGQLQVSIWTTSVCVFEIHFGIQILPTGKRRQRLALGFECMLREVLASRVLDYDVSAAIQAAEMGARLRRSGRSIDIRDLQLAGIVAARGAILATGNIKHFADTDIPIVDPWSA